MTDTVNVPRECRQRLASEGKAYPRSGCDVCGAFAPNWKSCDAALAAAPKADGMDAYTRPDTMREILDRQLADKSRRLNPEAPKVAQEPVAWRETFIAEEEDGPAVGILIDMPDGSQIWTGEVSDALLNASDERPDESGIFLVVARKSEGPRVVASVATPEDGFELARLIASRDPHTHPAPASDELLEALESIEAEAGRYAAMYPHGSDGRNTFLIFADGIARRIAKHKGPQS